MTDRAANFHGHADPVGAGVPEGWNSTQVWAREDGSLEMEFWFEGVSQRLPVDDLEPIAAAIADDGREGIEYLDVSSCVSAVEPFLRLLLKHGWVLQPPAPHNQNSAPDKK